MPPRRQQGRGRRQPYQLRPRDQNQPAHHARANRCQNPDHVQPYPVPDVQNPAPVVDPAPERDHVPVPVVQNPDPAPVFPRQNHVPQVSANQAAQPQGLQTVWIVGSSLIRRAAEHTRNRSTGRNLGLERYGVQIIWVGMNKMRWSHLTSLIQVTSQPGKWSDMSTSVPDTKILRLNQGRQLN